MHFRPPGGYIHKGVFGLDVGFGNMMLECAPTQQYSAAIGLRYIIKFTAASTSHTIKFTNWGHICSSCTELVLDNVRLYNLSELEPTIPPCSVNITETTSTQSIIISPNPSNGIFTVSQNNTTKTEIEITNIIGELIYKTTTATPQTAIDLSKQAKGIYFVRIEDEKKNVVNRKVVVQ